MGATDEPRARFYYPLSVRFADTDCQGHVYFSNYVMVDRETGRPVPVPPSFREAVARYETAA